MNKHAIQDLIYEIIDELERAIDKFPNWPEDPFHALAVFGEEYGELNKALLQYVYETDKANMDHLSKEAIQTVAMAIRFVMNIDKYNYLKCKQHKDVIERELN